MLPAEILKDFNLCYLKIQTIVQDKDWQKFIDDQEINPDAATHLNDVLHDLGEAMGCVEPLVDPD